MKKLKWQLGQWVRQFIFWLPRRLRYRIVKELIEVERQAPYRQALEALFQIHDDVSREIDQACFRWGDGVHIKHDLMDGIHAFFYERIPQNASVLDLGCGRGTVAAAIAQHANARVLGMDLNPKSIAFAVERYSNPNLRFMVGDVFCDLPENELFDVIVLSSVLEHLENRIEFLQDLAKKFAPQKILIRVPTFEQHYFKAIKRGLGLFAYVDRGHVLEYSPEIFAGEMAAAHLDIAHIEFRWGDIWAECIPEKQPVTGVEST